MGMLIAKLVALGAFILTTLHVADRVNEHNGKKLARSLNSLLQNKADRC